MADLVGIAAIIGAIGAPMVVVFNQYNVRRKIKDDLVAAALVITAAAKKDADEHLRILNEQTGSIARIEGNTDGALTNITAVATKLGIEKDALAVEVERRQANPEEPTHEGPPTAEHPVGMVGARAKAYTGLSGITVDKGDLNVPPTTEEKP